MAPAKNEAVFFGAVAPYGLLDPRRSISWFSLEILILMCCYSCKCFCWILFGWHEWFVSTWHRSTEAMEIMSWWLKPRGSLGQLTKKAHSERRAHKHAQTSQRDGRRTNRDSKTDDFGWVVVFRHLGKPEVWDNAGGLGARWMSNVGEHTRGGVRINWIARIKLWTCLHQ